MNRPVKVVPGHPAPHWRYEVLLPRRDDVERWELSVPCDSFTHAREELGALERLGYSGRVVFICRGGEVMR